MSALLHRWLTTDVFTKKQILDKLLLEKFMICMPPELQVLVKERRVQSCEELKVLLRNKKEPRKWKVVAFQGQKYLEENFDVQMPDEEVGDTDHVLELSMKYQSPISKTGVHPGKSQEVNREPGNQPGTSDIVWGQGHKVFLLEAIPTKIDLEGVRPMENLVKLEKDVMEDREEAAVLTSPEPPLPSSPGDSGKTEGEQNPPEGIGLECVDVGDIPPTQDPETQALSQRPKRRSSGNSGGKYLEENFDVQMPDEEVGDTDHVLELSMKYQSPISKTGVHPGKSQEVNREPGNQPGTSDIVWGQGHKVFLLEAIPTKIDLEGVRPMENLVKLEKDVMEDREEAAVLTSPEPPLPSSPGDSGKTEGEQNPPEGIGLECVDVGDIPPTQDPETQALSQRPKRRSSGNSGGATKRKKGNTPTPQEEPQEGAVSLDRGEVTRWHRCHSVGASSTVEPTGHPVGKESRRKVPYECQDCSKRFSYRSQLDIHQRTHTGERPFQCLVCLKGFIQASDLRVHQRIHTGEKPFFCKVCEKRFTHKSTLRSHQRVHTQDNPYECDVCHKSFLHRGNLNVHMRTHSGLRPYPWGN
ncbi:PREDICTED: zinc finger and SCAN domain-containing protein 5B-like [Myotis brandtii]|uniref:zinc finger and SCAN domain-containing protein 5B-like n=1 Tax=Myotis brandtii TaxID=109478 RepID=UPI00070440F8|nr:PREDICTED: zinc finger and SCAN domain-containing protein 5B-like [Myotis brandtii]